MSKYNVVENVKDLQQRICNIVCYVMWLYENKHISERTKNELLKLCNPNVKEGESQCIQKKN